MRTVPEYAKNFLFCIKNFWKFFFKMYKNLIDIWFCIFTISSSCTLHPWPSNCFLYKLFVIKLSKNHFKHCLNIDCQLFIGQTLFILRNLDWFCLKAHNLPFVHAKFQSTGFSGLASTSFWNLIKFLEF